MDTYNLKIFWDDTLKLEITSEWHVQILSIFEAHVKGHTSPKEYEIRAIVSKNAKVIISHTLSKKENDL